MVESLQARALAGAGRVSAAARGNGYSSGSAAGSHASPSCEFTTAPDVPGRQGSATLFGHARGRAPTLHAFRKRQTAQLREQDAAGRAREGSLRITSSGLAVGLRYGWCRIAHNLGTI